MVLSDILGTYREQDNVPTEDVPLGPTSKVLRAFSERQWDNLESKTLRYLMGTSPNVLKTSPVCWESPMKIGEGSSILSRNQNVPCRH
jgi:hypothetical protein